MKPQQLKTYEIWHGKKTTYAQGEGFPPTEPTYLGVATASSFRMACYIFVLQRHMDWVKETMGKEGDIYEGFLNGISYNAKDNSDPWFGKYYQSKQEAQESF